MSVRRFLTLALMAAGILPLLVFALLFRSVLGSHIKDDLRELSQSMLRTLAAQAGSSLLDGTRRDLPALLLLAEEAPGREGALLKAFRLPHDEYSLLAVRDDRTGRIEAVSPEESGALGAAYALHASPKLGTVSFSDPFASELSRAVSVEAVYTNGRKTLMALLDLAEISSKLVLIAQSPNDRLGVVDGEGRYLACSDPSRAQRLERVDASFLVGGPVLVESGGVEFYASSKPIAGGSWRALYLRSAADVDRPLVAFKWTILGLGLSALVCTILGAFFAWKNIAAPLSLLVARIDRIAEGRYAERVEGIFYSEFSEIGRAFNAMAESIERRDVDLLRSEERYRLLFYKNRVPTLVVDPAGLAITDANEAALAYYGFSRAELEGRLLGEIDLAPKETIAAGFASLIEGGVGIFPSHHRLRSGEIRDVELYASPVGLVGTRELYCVVFDVTERRLAEERTSKALAERTLLLREVYHRVKNNLQIVSSLLSLQAEGIEDEPSQRALRLAQDRVYAMSLAHELVYQMSDLTSVEASDYASQLIANLQLVYGAGALSVLSDLEPMKLGLDRAIPFGLALNELVSNAFKYASPSARAPVRISLALAGGDGKAEVLLSVEDSGPGISEELRAAGGRPGSLGLSLIEALANQLGGRTVWGRGANGTGTSAEIRFPAEER